MRLVLLCALLAAACGSPRRGAALGDPIAPKNEAQRRGQRAFAVFCSQCHPGGEGGLGPALNNKPVPAAAIKLQVRQGAGSMPAFAEDELPDDVLDDLVTYMRAVR